MEVPMFVGGFWYSVSKPNICSPSEIRRGALIEPGAKPFGVKWNPVDTP